MTHQSGHPGASNRATGCLGWRSVNSGEIESTESSSPLNTLRTAPKAPTGSRRWRRRLPTKMKSKVPTSAGSRSYRL
jgi:hypothetical protein